MIEKRCKCRRTVVDDEEGEELATETQQVPKQQRTPQRNARPIIPVTTYPELGNKAADKQTTDATITDSNAAPVKSATNLANDALQQPSIERTPKPTSPAE